MLERTELELTEVTTDAMAQAVEATASVARSAPALLRIVLGLLMVALAAILWFVTTILLDEHGRLRKLPRRRARSQGR